MSELAKAMSVVQSKVLSVGKDKTAGGGGGPRYTYATLGNVIEHLFPILAENGLCVMQPLDNINGEPALRTIIMHSGGESVDALFPLEKAGMKGVNDAQQIGAAITYMRRYGLCAAFGLITEDDDAACLSKRPASPQRAAAEPQGSLQDRAKAIPTPQQPDGAIPTQVIGVLDKLNTMEQITVKCKEYKSMATKEGWDKALFRYWQMRDDGFKELQKEVFGS